MRTRRPNQQHGFPPGRGTPAQHKAVRAELLLVTGRLQLSEQVPYQAGQLRRRERLDRKDKKGFTKATYRCYGEDMRMIAKDIVRYIHAANESHPNTRRAPPPSILNPGLYLTDGLFDQGHQPVIHGGFFLRLQLFGPGPVVLPPGLGMPFGRL